MISDSVLKQLPYDEFVATLCKDGQEIINQMTPMKAHLWHMGTGVGGEAGELEDAIKKHCIYNKPLDRENIVEELGDLKFFMRGIQNSLRITDEEIELANKRKLAIRYSTLTYSDAEAQGRADKGVQE